MQNAAATSGRAGTRRPGTETRPPRTPANRRRSSTLCTTSGAPRNWDVDPGGRLQRGREPRGPGSPRVRRLSGAEINPNAIAQMRESFPELDATVTEERSRTCCPDCRRDPWTWCSRSLCSSTSSDEPRDLPRDRADRPPPRVRDRGREHHGRARLRAQLPAGIRARGLRAARAAMLTERAHPGVGPNYWGYTARLFAAPPVG